MKQKRFLSLLLAALMLVTLAFGTGAAAYAETSDADVDQQLNLIVSQLDKLGQKNGENTWYYTVTDLDHDGNLEFIAASQHPQDRSTNVKAWEVSKDRSTLTECRLAKDADESFPDILTDNTDTYYVNANDTWYYLMFDNIVLSDYEVYTIKTVVHLKDGVIGYDPLAIEHAASVGGYREVTHIDTTGVAISAEQYNATGNNVFAAASRSNTSFDWFRLEDAKLSRLADSYAVFAGRKAPTEVFPVPKPTVLSQPEKPQATATPAPMATPTTAAASTAPVYLSVTKNPTNESKKPGGTAYFVSCANAFESLTWTMVSPNGGEYSTQSFAHMYADAVVSGDYSTTLSISNVASDMSGWGAYCTFYYKGQTARTSTAYLYVEDAPQPYVPTPVSDGGVYYGYVSDWSFGTVSVVVDGYTTLSIPWDVVSLTGNLDYGVPATVYWQGRTTKGVNVTYCAIEGSNPTPTYNYGSMSGTAYHSSAYQIYVVLQNGVGTYVNGGACNIVYGTFDDGCACTVYYTFDSNGSYDIYQVDIYGNEDYWDGGWAGSQYYNNYWEDPDYTMGGWAGSQYYDSYDYWSDPDYTQGGWAGSHYYDNDNYNDGFTFNQYGDGYEMHTGYNPDGSTYSTVTCPGCHREVSMAYGICPYCGYPIW